MGRISVKLFLLVTLGHVAGTMLLIDACLSQAAPYQNGDTSLWLAILLWIWEPVPMLFSRWFHFGPAGFFYHLTLPWSALVGLFLGFLLPHLRRLRCSIA